MNYEEIMEMMKQDIVDMCQHYVEAFKTVDDFDRIYDYLKEMEAGIATKLDALNDVDIYLDLYKKLFKIYRR